MITAKDIQEEKVMALSWRQPYADMMIAGKIETRTWPTNYRGLVLICASKESYLDSDIQNITGMGASFKFLAFFTRLPVGIEKRSYNFLKGHAIAIGRLVDCRPMAATDQTMTLVLYKKPWVETLCRGKKRQFKMVEKLLWCHVYEDVMPIEPFEWKGTLGWKTVSDDVKALIKMI